MTTLLTGASGFIGRRLASRLQADRPDNYLCCLVKAEEDVFCRTGVELLAERSIWLIPSDLTTGTGIENLPKPDTLFHLAANTHTWECDHSCNDVGTENLIRRLAPLGPGSHVVFTSTTAVMDNRDDLDKPLTASQMVKFRPFSPYGQSKLRAEDFLRAEAVRQGFRLSIVRLCTVYGPQPRPNTLLDVINREVASESIASRLNWPGLTSFVHVDDVVSYLMEIGNRPPQAGEVNTYLVATESGTLADVSRLVHRAKGLAYRSIRLPNALWKALELSHQLCRLKCILPLWLYNNLWRFNICVNPIFNCDTSSIVRVFPSLNARHMADCIDEILCPNSVAAESVSSSISEGTAQFIRI